MTYGYFVETDATETPTQDQLEYQTHLWLQIEPTEWAYAAGNSAHWAPGSLIADAEGFTGFASHGSTEVTFDPETGEYVFTIRVKWS